MSGFIRAKCRHCFKREANRPRGLCWTCYYTDGVREQYTPAGKFGRAGVSAWAFGGHRPMPEPTATLPGTPERMAVLEQRATRGESLWHPGDARGDLS